MRKIFSLGLFLVLFILTDFNKAQDHVDPVQVTVDQVQDSADQIPISVDHVQALVDHVLPDNVAQQPTLEPQISSDNSNETKSRKNSKRKEKSMKEQENADEKHIMEEWETHMSDFVPADMLTFEIAPRYTEVNLGN